MTCKMHIQAAGVMMVSVTLKLTKESIIEVCTDDAMPSGIPITVMGKITQTLTRSCGGLSAAVFAVMFNHFLGSPAAIQHCSGTEYAIGIPGCLPSRSAPWGIWEHP